MKKIDRIQLLHSVITWRGSHQIKPSMALRLRKQTFSEPLEALRKKRMEEAHAERERLTEALYEADIKKYGHFCMEVWSRDCDMCESTFISKYKSVAEFKESQEASWEDAEGPITWRRIHPEDAADFVPSVRDLVMENYENQGDGYHLSRTQD
jgi:hypothetical protein